MPRADLRGWYRVPVPPTGKLGRQQWHVDSEQNVLVCDGDGGHDMLLFEKEIGNAIFHFEFRYTKVEDKTGCNSGACVRNSKDGSIWHQAQFGDAKDGYLFGETLTPDGKRKFFNLAKSVTDKRVKPAGEWNTFEVTAHGKVLLGGQLHRFADFPYGESNCLHQPRCPCTFESLNGLTILPRSPPLSHGSQVARPISRSI